MEQASESTPMLVTLGSQKKSSAVKTLGNIVISIVGSGVLGLPYSFRRSGWLSGLLSLVFVSFLTYYGMVLLVQSKKKLLSKAGSDQDSIRTYGELGYEVYGTAGKVAADVSILLAQGGFCVAYLIFIGQNLSSITAGGTKQKIIFISIIGLLQMIFSWMKSLTKLAPFSILADFVNLSAFAIVLFRDFGSFSESRTMPAPFKGWGSVSFAFGVGVYAFEGAGMILSLESNMEDPSEFGTVLGIAFTLIASFYSLFGAAGYFGFGENTKEIITLNLPRHWSTDAVKLAICFSLFFTFPVMMTPVHEIYERRYESSLWFQDNVAGNKPLRLFLRRAVRSAVVSLVVLVALAVPQFSVFISLVGSTVCSLLGFVLPALFHIHAMGDSISHLQLSVNWFLVLFGIGFGTWGTIQTVSSIL